MPIYRPRMACQLTVPLMGDRAARTQQDDDTDVVTFDVKVRRVRLVSNDANHADEAFVTCDFTDAGIDPRLLQDGIAVICIGNADENDRWTPAPSDIRFIGILTRAKRSARDSEPMAVELEFLDYTTLFLEAKPFGAKGIPDYSMTLAEAWARICTQVPGSEALSDQLVLVGIDKMPKLSDAVHDRLASGPIAVKSDTDGWAVWRRCVDTLGLISFIRGDQCIVTTARDLYSQDDPVRMVWGSNIKEFAEARNPVFRKGIGLRSFNPITGRILDAFWPPLDDPSVRRKIVKARKKKGPAKAPASQTKEWEFFPYPGVTDLALLVEIAHRVWEERTRQEVEGTVSTCEMFVDKLSGESADLLALQAGDAIRVEFDQGDREMLQSLPSEGARIQYLLDRGYSEGIAELMAKNVSTLAKLRPVFLVRTVETTLEVDAEGGTFEIQINYVNKIDIFGDTAGNPAA